MNIIDAINLEADGRNSGSSASSYNTASFAPSAKTLLLAFVGQNKSGGGPNVPSISGLGLTWELLTSFTYNTDFRASIFHAMSDSTPTPGAATIDFAGQNQTDLIWAFDQIENVVPGDNGLNAIVQANTYSATETGTANATLSPFASTSNGTYGAIYVPDVVNINAGSGFERLCLEAPGHTVETQFASNNQTTIPFDVSGGSTRRLAIALEIKAYFKGGFIM